MRRSNAAKVRRLRDGETAADDLAASAGPDLDTIRQIRDLDERLDAAGFPPLLDATDRRIVDDALAVGRIRYATLAAALGVHRTTVWRRVRRLLATAPALHRRGATLLGEAVPQPWPVFKKMLKTYAWTGVGKPPEGALEIDDFNKLAEMYRAGSAARQLLSPPYIVQLERRGGKVVITGPGPLEPSLREAVRAGEAERIYDPPRCHSCGKFISRRATGRPSKYCTERCRSRYRRRL